MGRTSVDDLQNPQANYAKLKSPPIWFGFFPGFGVSAAPDNPKDLNKLFFNKTHHQHGSAIYWPEKKLLDTWSENSNLRVGQVNDAGAWTFIARSEEIAARTALCRPAACPVA